ncbi:MAG TPA: ribulose-phosphate 3-epimerase [Miltoncostaeaceae bacterium]|nr:ribulose-phosphate 3-epimerase [Miltoncostaeaceae bacterium]
MRARPLPAEPEVLPSVMSADMLHLGAQLTSLVEAGARVVHVDVMDGHFVPNLTVGPDFTRAVAAAVRPRGVRVDVHVMAERPGELIGLFAPHADAISVHLEADPHPHRLLGAIRDAGCAAGIAINPGTPVEALREMVDDIDYVNCMGVSPGFAGQGFVPATPDKVRRLRALLPARVVIEVDGGISAATLPGVRDAGARWFVSASSVFGSPDPLAAFAELCRLARD